MMVMIIIITIIRVIVIIIIITIIIIKQSVKFHTNNIDVKVGFIFSFD